MDDEISPDEVHSLLEANEDVCIVDIRDEQQFEQAHIPDSINLPFHSLPAMIDELEGEERIVTVCPIGQSSIQAARLISSYEGTADGRVESMSGGLEEWSQSYELTSSEDAATTTTEAGANAESADAPESPF